MSRAGGIPVVHGREDVKRAAGRLVLASTTTEKQLQAVVMAMCNVTNHDHGFPGILEGRLTAGPTGGRPQGGAGVSSRLTFPRLKHTGLPANWRGPTREHVSAHPVSPWFSESSC